MTKAKLSSVQSSGHSDRDPAFARPLKAVDTMSQTGKSVKTSTTTTPTPTSARLTRPPRCARGWARGFRKATFLRGEGLKVAFLNLVGAAEAAGVGAVSGGVIVRPP